MDILSYITLSSHKIFIVFLGLLGLGFLIGLHELGHFLFCKLFRVSTPSFSIGFGPRIFSKKIGETTFSLSAIPVGGYVEIAGMAEVAQGEQKEASRKDEYSFASKPYYQKVLIMSGGILFNTLLWVLCLFLSFHFHTLYYKSFRIYSFNFLPFYVLINKFFNVHWLRVGFLAFL